MTRDKNAPRAPRPAARSTAHAAPAAALAPDTAVPPGSPAEAACAAVAASPGGATTAGVADALGIGRAAARDALTALETAGTVTRTKGGKPGIPDTWTLTVTEPAAHQPGDDPSPDDQPAASSQPGSGDSGRAGPDGPGEQEAAGGSGPQTVSDDQASPGAATAAGQATPRDGSPGTPDTGTGPKQDEDEPGGEPPDPALVAEITGCIEQIQAAASATATALTSGGDQRAALAGMDEIYDQAVQARRALKAATGGRKTPAARPGGLRQKILAHLRDHPGKDFTPHEIHKVLGNSSGAIANALDTLVSHGDAELATEKPRRFRLAGNHGPGGDHAPEAEADGPVADHDANLAGAA